MMSADWASGMSFKISVFPIPGVSGAMRLRLPGRVVEFPRRPLVMGIVNVNDDSFSGDGTLDAGEGIKIARAQVEAGADVIDVGAESARTNRKVVAIGEEIRRFQGFLARWEEAWKTAGPRDAQQVWPPVLSINSWRPEVIGSLLETGRVDLVNDMGGLPDDANARLCAKTGAALLVMHSVGEPKVPHFHQQWDDVMASIGLFFEEKLALCEAAGMDAESTILDPGIDFAKQQEDNLTVFRELECLQRFGRPLLVPVSRKTVIGEVLGLADPRDRDAGTVACMAATMARGAALFRVHHVDAAWQSIKLLDALVR